jgi:peptidoglycan/LPS O-acetylase OafA/YrhL
MATFYERFRRVTSSGDFIPVVDGLRFLAIAGVLATHINGVFFNLTAAGQWAAHENDLLLRFIANAGRGVELFFVISGFILALPFARYHLTGGREVRLRSYYLRRVTRLEPPYLLVLLGLLVVYLVLADATNRDLSRLDILSSVGASAIYSHYFFFGEPSLVNGPMWSLEVEVQFYVLAPLFAFVFKLPRVGRRVLLASLIALAPFGQHSLGLTKHTLLGCIQYFLIGFLLADFYLHGFKVRLSGALGFVAGVGLLPLLFWIPFRSAGPVAALAFAVTLFAFYYVVFTNVHWTRLFSYPLLTVIGGMCYTIYLVHQPIIKFLGRFTRRFLFEGSFLLSYTAQFVLLVVIVMAVSGVFFLAVEKPCMYKDWPQRLRDALLRREPQPAARRAV